MQSFDFKDIYIENGKRVLEINILPERYCNFDCIFCPIARSKNKLDVQVSFSSIEGPLANLAKEITQANAELIFINAKGEAMIHNQIFTIIRFIKDRGLPIRLLSNGYLFGKKEYMSIANQCDEIIGELKVITEDAFQKLQRPMEGYTLENYISNMVLFKKQYGGKFILEITILRGYNDDEAAIQKLKEIIEEISPNQVILARLEEERFQKKFGITDERFAEIAEIFQCICPTVF